MTTPMPWYAKHGHLLQEQVNPISVRSTATPTATAARMRATSITRSPSGRMQLHLRHLALGLLVVDALPESPDAARVTPTASRLAPVTAGRAQPPTLQLPRRSSASLRAEPTQARLGYVSTSCPFPVHYVHMLTKALLDLDQSPLSISHGSACVIVLVDQGVYPYHKGVLSSLQRQDALAQYLCTIPVSTCH